MSKVMGTRAGWRDDIPFSILKNLYGMFSNCTRICSQTRVELWLSAAGLFAGKVHTDAEAMKNIHDGLAGSGKE